MKVGILIKLIIVKSLKKDSELSWLRFKKLKKMIIYRTVIPFVYVLGSEYWNTKIGHLQSIYSLFT